MRVSSGEGSSARPIVVLGGIAAVATLAYTLVYPWRGFRLPIGFDAPVYLWSGLRAAAFGLDDGMLVPRPGAFGLAATLSSSPLPDMTSVASLLIAVVVAAALAAAAWVASTFGARLALAVSVTLAVTFFLTPLANGYLSAGLFLASFTAAVTVLAAATERTWRTTILVAMLLTAAGLGHPLFAVIGVPILATVVAALFLFRGTVPRWRVALAQVVAAGIIAGAVTLLAVVVLLDPGAGSADTSADAALSRLGGTGQLTIFRRHQLEAELAPFLFLVLGAVLAIDRALEVRNQVPGGSARPRLLFWAIAVGWFAILGAGTIALLAGVPIPVHRILWVLLPPVLVVVVAGHVVPRTGRPGPGTRWDLVVRSVVPIVIVTIFAVSHGVLWRRLQPTVTSEQASVLSRLEAGLRQVVPEDVPVVVLGGDRVPVLDLFDLLNWARALMSPGRMESVWVYPGGPDAWLDGDPTRTGDRFRDAIVADYAGRIAGLRDRAPVVVAAGAIDVASADRAREISGTRRFGADAVLLPPRRGDRVRALGSAGAATLMAPWSVVLGAPLLLAAFGAIGLGWTSWSLRGRPALVRFGLAPAVGAAMLMVASVVVDLVGVRLGSGGWVVAVVLAILPGGVLAIASRRLDGPAGGG
jgi:hypothetical protein